MKQIISDAIEAIEDLLKHTTHKLSCKANHGTICTNGFESRNWHEPSCTCHMKKGKAVLELLKKVNA